MNPTILAVENGQHELLPEPAVREAVVAFFGGVHVRGRRLASEPPRFLSVEDARKPIRRPGQ